MRTGHLFAGAGGGLLADLILGHEPVVAVEQDANCCEILRLRTPQWFPELHVHEGDIRLFDPSDWQGRVDCLHAGFPCQDISAAGTGSGIHGERSGLINEVFRAVDAIQPRFIFLENSPRIRTRGRNPIITELVARRYAWRDGTLAASDVGAWHDRKRWWLLAANTDGLRELQPERSLADKWRWLDNRVKKTANALRKRRPHGSGQPTVETSQDIRRSTNVGTRQVTTPRIAAWFETEPNVGRLVYGLANEMVPGAVKALGNGQVPLQAAMAYLLLGGPISR